MGWGWGGLGGEAERDPNTPQQPPPLQGTSHLTHTQQPPTQLTHSHHSVHTPHTLHSIRHHSRAPHTCLSTLYHPTPPTQLTRSHHSVLTPHTLHPTPHHSAPPHKNPTPTKTAHTLPPFSPCTLHTLHSIRHRTQQPIPPHRHPTQTEQPHTQLTHSTSPLTTLGGGKANCERGSQRGAVRERYGSCVVERHTHTQAT